LTKYGPDNPHPLSRLRTELVWEGKYDEYGSRREVDIAGSALPMQRIETIDEPRSRAQGQGRLFDEEKAHRDDFRNRLIWGDNKLVMASLLKEFKGRVDLIYIDPPFDVGADFTMDVAIGDAKETIAKDQSTLEMVAYRDMWGKGTDSYIHMMFERLTLMKELLSDNGSIYVHVGWQVSSPIRILMDELFGNERFLNEIAWRRSAAHSDANRFGIIHDTILVYSKSAAVDHS
jgi:adenine-specific DNA-methyltransferase